tara:strand:+ start:357 stop:680 length:324 start_codon:yes stop_codon:yes gene_type:complete
MIDTDKYEGHQVSELKTAVAGPSHSWVTHQHKHGAKDFMFVNHATAALITDAPLLLEEVKRLQIYERIVLCIALHQQLPDGLHVDEELMLRAREHLRKNGEWEGEEE